MSPQCVGIIMDGNRRFARERGLPTLEGHRRGYEKLKEALKWVRECGASYLVVYAFSTENWNRTAEEVSYLMDLFRLVFRKELGGFKKDGYRVRCIGERERFAPDLQEMTRNAEEETAGGAGPTLVLALSYGGRAEILAAANAAIEGGERALTEERFRRYFWSHDIPDPDLIIRTGGEMRLSGFLPWQSVYSELFFTDTYWPDFSKEEFFSILDGFSERTRNFGK
ncbi:MAG: polyprenyl diphosphate synthase [Patescibacteria group bacterium]